LVLPGYSIGLKARDMKPTALIPLALADGTEAVDVEISTTTSGIPIEVMTYGLCA
jgi:hypothetical protein